MVKSQYCVRKIHSGLDSLFIAAFSSGKATDISGGERRQTSGLPPVRGRRAAVIVPVAGVYPELKENLRSRLTQDYPQYQVIFATRSEDDPATEVIRTLLPDYPLARLVICGPASGCSQKNHNLLAGLKAIEPEVDILVFSDANQTTPAHWLKALVQPLVQGEAGCIQQLSSHHPAR